MVAGICNGSGKYLDFTAKSPFQISYLWFVGAFDIWKVPSTGS
jgi:hypothetical protein